jgi:hypothetical protein
MKMKKNVILISIISILFVSMTAYCQTVSDYLILQDVGPYKLSQSKKLIPGMAPVGGPQVSQDAGVLSATGHFPDHADKTYEVMYLGGGTYVSPTVEITQHVGGDSDKWLLHEIEKGFRDSKIERLGLVLQGALIRKIGMDKVFSHGIGGGGYRWLSNNNIVVDVSYTSLVAGKPKPTEIVQAYLAKFPSVIPTALILDSAHDVVWIKDEMDRRLWLCDKWVLQIQPGDVKLYDKLDSVVSNMNSFLDYREKYFGIVAKDDKLLLLTALSKKDDASIKTKLAEYKTWWNEHKNDSITVQEKKVQSTEYRVQSTVN